MRKTTVALAFFVGLGLTGCQKWAYEEGTTPAGPQVTDAGAPGTLAPSARAAPPQATDAGGQVDAESEAPIPPGAHDVEGDVRMEGGADGGLAAPVTDAGAQSGAAAGSGGKEEACLDAWLKKKGLDPYGNKEGTMYMGGTPLFDERTGEQTPRAEFVYGKHPEAKKACRSAE